MVSNREKDCYECLKIYRKRESIESYFEAEKQHADGNRIRVWSPDTLRGRMFVQFISLCYYEYFSEQLRKIKPTLGKTVRLANDAGHYSTYVCRRSAAYGPDDPPKNIKVEDLEGMLLTLIKQHIALYVDAKDRLRVLNRRSAALAKKAELERKLEETGGTQGKS